VPGPERTAAEDVCLHGRWLVLNLIATAAGTATAAGLHRAIARCVHTARLGQCIDATEAGNSTTSYCESSPRPRGACKSCSARADTERLSTTMLSFYGRSLERRLSCWGVVLKLPGGRRGTGLARRFAPAAARRWLSRPAARPRRGERRHLPTRPRFRKKGPASIDPHVPLVSLCSLPFPQHGESICCSCLGSVR